MSLVSLSLKYDVLIRISGDGCSQVHFCNVYDFRQESRMNKMLSTLLCFFTKAFGTLKADFKEKLLFNQIKATNYMY